jgi:HlyD family secretion protein
MIRKLILPVLALAGVLLSWRVVKMTNEPTPIAQPVVEPSLAPYRWPIAGAGIVEAASENIAIGTVVAGVVTDVFVKVGDTVMARDALFHIDDRDLQAELVVRQAALESARRKLAKLVAQPRPEDVPPLQANVDAQKAALDDAVNQFHLYESLGDRRAVSQDEFDRRKYAVQVDEAKLKQAEADLAQLKAGAWQPDVAIARADVASAEAMVRQTQIEIERRTVRAPIDGRLLQVKIHPGEYATGGVLEQALMLLGDTSTLNVRVDIDENDAWRLLAGAAARATLRGNPERFVDLKFVRVEPYVIPKKSLTGDSTERVDTRVLQVIYSFDPGRFNVFAGQQVDVTIDAAPDDALKRHEPATMPAQAGA